MTAHATHVAHANSVATFVDLDIGKREALVLNAYLLAGRIGMTDRECAERLGLTDLNGCRPRITNLVARGLLWECGAVRCGVTGRKVRVCIPMSLAEKAGP